VSTWLLELPFWCTPSASGTHFHDPSCSGRPRSALFLLKPVKKDYPDYYAFIKQPIAFEDIRKKLNHDTYSSLAQIKADFELCFNNAKAYNLETSQVYADADALLVRTSHLACKYPHMNVVIQKLTGKTYKSLLPPEERNQAKDEAKGPGHSLNKHLKSRLKKLMELTDDRYGLSSYPR